MIQSHHNISSNFVSNKDSIEKSEILFLLNNIFEEINFSTNEHKDAKICVAMSGGVDSALCGVLFKEAGYNVEGITLKLYESNVERDGACCSFRDISDAKRVAQQFNFPHYVIDYKKEFKEQVIDTFINDYYSGRTPIPCVKCNQVIKFNYLFKLIKDLNFDFLVTGHYILKRNNSLYIAKDKTKDQSYFLYNINSEQLKNLIFPLGNLYKKQTRAIAEYLGIKVSNKPDSQDICFVEDGSYKNFLEANSERSENLGGDIIHVDGRKLGNHSGIHHFTIGQRKGIGVAYSEPLYVIKIDTEEKKVIVGEKKFLAKHIVYFNEVTWVNNDEMFDGKVISVKLRSMQKNTIAILHIDEKNHYVILNEPQYFVSPGQACVLYEGEKLLGGGTIISSE
jgi:tRNA-specific 2-thiouridylase